MSFSWGHWYLCFGLLVTSALGFKAWVDSLHAFLSTCYSSLHKYKLFVPPTFFWTYNLWVSLCWFCLPVLWCRRALWRGVLLHRLLSYVFLKWKIHKFSQQGGHIPAEIKFPVFSLGFPCVTNFFPVFFSHKINRWFWVIKDLPGL